MRNLKKVLSLALALVMLLGMMVVGAGAATSFKDDAEIKNQEAVAVLVGMGIMKGRGDGTNFEPAGTLTRAEAAKMIAQLDLGVEAADALVGNGTSPFSDVWSGYWAEGAIDYCVEQGYIAGDGNGHFFPGRNVSSVEFGIMLLRLLGYDAKNEGLVGDQWATKGAALARKAGLTTSVAANTQPMTRDAMAQMAFNVLTATLVEYNGLNGTIGDATFSSPASPRYHNANDLGISNLTYDGKVPSATTTIKFCEEHFPNLKLVTGSRDDFEREYSVWTWKNVDIAGSKQIVTANFEFTEKKSSVNLNGAAGDANTEVYINGKPQSADDIKAIQSALSATQTGYVTSGVVAYLTQNGRQVLVYLNENNYKDIDKVVVIDTFVARVSAVSSANETTTVTTMSVPGTLDSRTVEMTGYAVGDIVAYTAAWNGSSKYVIQEMDVLTDPVTGTLTKWSGSSVETTDKGGSQSNFTIDSGDPYKYSYCKAIRDIDGGDVQIYAFTANKSELNVYLDKYGFALYVEGVEGEKNYAAVIGIGESNAYGSETKGVTLLLADGTTVEATAKLANNAAWNTLKGIDNGTVGAWGGDNKNLVTDGVADVVTYTVDSKGVYTLTLVATTGSYAQSTETGSDNGYVFKNGKSEFKIPGHTYYTTSKTIFMVCTGTGTNRTYHVYTGYANAPGIKANSADSIEGIAYGLNRRYTNQIDVVYIDASSMDNMTGASTYFVKSNSPTVYTDSTGKYFVLPAIVDGEVTEIKIDAGLEQNWNGTGTKDLVEANAGLYAIDGVQKDENDIITGCTLKTNAAAFRATNDNNGKAGTIAANGEVLGWRTSPETFWAYNDKTNVFFVDKDYKTITKMAVADVQDDENDLIYADHDGNADNKKLSNVVIVEQDPTPDAVTYALPAVPGAQWSTNGGTSWANANTATTAASGASIKLKFATAPASIVVTLNDNSTQATTESPAGTYSFTMPSQAVKSVDVTPKAAGAYDGKIIVDYNSNGDTGADNSTNVMDAVVTVYIGEDAPNEDQVVDAVIAAFQKDYPTYTNVDSSNYPVLKFTSRYSTLYVTCADASIKTPTKGVEVADAAGLTAFLGGTNGTAVLTANVETATALTANHPVIVPEGITLTLNGDNDVKSNGKISGDGKVIIKTGDITSNANIEVADVEIQAGSIDGTPASMDLNVTGNAELKGANSGEITVAADKTLTVSGTTALGADITGAGMVSISGTGVSNGDKVKTTGGMVLPNSSSIDKVGAIPLTIGSAASDTASITGAATPSSLTFGNKGVTLTLSTAGALTVPAGATLSNVTVTAGSLTLAGDANVAEGAKIEVAASQTIDFASHKLTGGTGSTIDVKTGATVSNFTAADQNFYNNADTNKVSASSTFIGKVSTWNTAAGGTDVAGWKVGA